MNWLKRVFGSVPAYPNSGNDSTVSGTTPRIGDLDDGGVYVGKSASTGQPLHAALADEPEYLTFGEALAAAERLKAEHSTAHVPTPRELNQLYVSRDTGHLRGTFNTGDSFPASVYRSSAPYDFSYAQVQWFDDGHQDSYGRVYRLPVRLVW